MLPCPLLQVCKPFQLYIQHSQSSSVFLFGNNKGEIIQNAVLNLIQQKQRAENRHARVLAAQVTLNVRVCYQRLDKLSYGNYVPRELDIV